ncbi:MAG: TonB-dependent hemoglobin/transferrin/lactoferrin family receptor [Sphingobium sp.]
MISRSRYRTNRNLVLAWLATTTLSIAAFGGAAPAHAQETASYDIPAGPLSTALNQFARQAKVELIYDAPLTQNATSPGLKGSYDTAEALSLLLAQSGVTFRRTGARVFTLAAAPNSTQSSAGAQGQVDLGPLRVEGRQAGGSGGIGRGGAVGAGGAAGGADEIFVAPRAVSIVTREEMDRTPARHAADLISEVPGVTSPVNRLNPGLAVNIRGMQDFGRVNMMIDGMRQNFVQNGHQQRNGQMYVDPELITGVTIERGPRNTVHGAGAIAGTVDFRTIGPEDILDGDSDRIGAQLRASTGLGGEGNGVNFLGSAAVAGRLTGNLEVIAAYSRRDIGDYDIGTKGKQLFYPSIQDEAGNELVTGIKYASQLQESALAKARLTLGDHQFQLSYLGTWISYNNVGDMYGGSDSDETGTFWSQIGHSRVGAENFAFDYSWKPDSNWIDLKLKLYHVNTRSRNYTDAKYPTDGTAGRVDMAWSLGFCEQEEIPTDWATSCGYGYGMDQLLRTRTYGVQLDNSSRFNLGGKTTLTANYGVEFFQDRTHSDVTIDREGRIVDTYNQYGQGDTLNPRGRRSMGSLFANIEVKNDLYTLGAGLRYERFWLTGKTQVLGVTSTYYTRFDQFLRYSCRGTTNATLVRYCQNGTEYGEAWAIANVPRYQTLATFTPGWRDATGFYEYEVDRSEGRFLPSFSAALRPTPWLELYGSWAKSWRPPAINEALMTGGHPGDPIANMFANPYADPEKSTTWELGANFNFAGIFKSEDVFFAKVGYFNTKARDYLYTTMVARLPGETSQIPGLGRVMFVNNLLPTRFEGLEIEARYDAGIAYAGVAATIYTGGRNRFLQKVYPLGVGVSRYDRPLEDGSLTEQQQAAIAAGFPTWQAWMESLTYEGGAFNSIAVEPSDRITATVGVRLFDRHLDTGVRLIHSGDGGFYYNQSGERIEGLAAFPRYTTLDWYGSFTLNARFRFYASIENLTDRRYVDAKSDALAMVAAPGRTITGGIQMIF